MTAARPGIHQLGTVHDDGHTVTISGWGLSICVAGCRCHQHPTTGLLQIWQDEQRGLLGLCQFSGSRQCGCCEPWSAAELQDVLRDVADVRALEATS